MLSVDAGSATDLSEDLWLDALLEHVVAEPQWSRREPPNVTTVLTALLPRCPGALSVGGRLATRAALAHLLLRCHADQETRPAEVHAAVVSLLRRPLDGGQVRGDLVEVMDLCDRLAAPRPDLPPVEPRIRQTLQLIRERYAEPSLSLAAAAKGSRISKWHLSRLLRQYTGQTFREHLHQTRILAACRLLTVSLLSVKEVAATVGYEGTQQLDRHFRRHLGVTPMTYRRRSTITESGVSAATIAES